MHTIDVGFYQLTVSTFEVLVVWSVVTFATLYWIRSVRNSDH